MNQFLAPDPTGTYTTGWLRPYPYPVVRYWPFRPYCTRWFWFRPIPWRNYRYLPPVLHTTIASANAENGGGFVGNVNPQQVAAPLDPPTIGADGRYTSRPDSFFDIFTDLGECRYRAAEQQIGDNDGNGNTTPGDAPRAVSIDARVNGPPIDTRDDDFAPPLVVP